MDKKFENFYKRALISAKAEVDVAFWFLTGLLSTVIVLCFPVTNCKVAPKYDAYGFEEMGIKLCDIEYASHVAAITWFLFSGLRILFLMSSAQGGWMLKLHGLRMLRRDGRPMAAQAAIRVVILEWLPFHLYAIHNIILPWPVSLFNMGVVISFAFAAQIIWLAPVIFRFHGMNIAQYLTGTYVVFTDKKRAKIEKIYQTPWRRGVKYISLTLSEVIAGVCAVYFVFISVQILRAPAAVHPEYERLLYADQEPVWEGNLYFYVSGLYAPAEVADTYLYAQKKTAQAFISFEEAKKASGIKYLYPPPENKNFTRVTNDGVELEISHFKSDDLSCHYSMEKKEGVQCPPAEVIEMYIKDNAVMWRRFNELPPLEAFKTPPQSFGFEKLQHFISLSQFKAFDIIQKAKNNRAVEAYSEWMKYHKIYNAMAGARETMVFKAVMGVVLKTHLDALETLLYLYPDLAKTHGAELKRALSVGADGLFRAPYMLSDDIGFLEPVWLGSMGNINAIRNDYYACILEWQRIARLPHHEYPFGEKREFCTLDRLNTPWRMAVYAAVTPGFFITNLIQTLLAGGVFKGFELVTHFKVFEVRLRMMTLGVQILEQGILAKEIPAFIANAPLELQNPIMRKPFEWDAGMHSLYFINPVDKEMKKTFQLNVK